MDDNRPIVECILCGKPTPMLGTRLCDSCWEVKHRVEAASIEVLNKILKGRGLMVVPTQEAL